MTTTSSGYHPSVAPLAFILSLNDSLAERSFTGIPETDLWTRPTPQSNPMLWIFGHIVHMRGQMLKLLGGTFESDWGDVFSRGAALQDAAAYPPRDRLVDAAREVNARLYAALSALGDADVLAFLTMHDTYHTGQLAYVRKALGLPGVVG
jgi:uncharacterized damage-inducible protein DinB